MASAQEMPAYKPPEQEEVKESLYHKINLFENPGDRFVHRKIGFWMTVTFVIICLGLAIFFLIYNLANESGLLVIENPTLEQYEEIRGYNPVCYCRQNSYTIGEVSNFTRSLSGCERLTLFDVPPPPGLWDTNNKLCFDYRVYKSTPPSAERQLQVLCGDWNTFPAGWDIVLTPEEKTYRDQYQVYVLACTIMESLVRSSLLGLSNSSLPSNRLLSSEELKAAITGSYNEVYQSFLTRLDSLRTSTNAYESFQAPIHMSYFNQSTPFPGEPLSRVPLVRKNETCSTNFADLASCGTTNRLLEPLWPFNYYIQPDTRSFIDLVNGYVQENFTINTDWVKYFGSCQIYRCEYINKNDNKILLRVVLSTLGIIGGLSTLISGAMRITKFLVTIFFFPIDNEDY